MTVKPWLIAASLVATMAVAASSSAQATIPRFGISVAIAREKSDDRKSPRVVDDAWVFGQIEDANKLFAPLGLDFRWTLEKDLPEPHGEMHSRADRDALTPLMERSVIDVFVVRELEDVDEPGRYRMGVCWTGRQQRRFIILSRTARPTVLAHELGHFFGNHQHSTVVNNLMSYQRDGGAVFFDERQIATIPRFTNDFLASRRLIDVGPPWRSF